MNTEEFTPEELAELEALAEGRRVLEAAGVSLATSPLAKGGLLPEDFSWMED